MQKLLDEVSVAIGSEVSSSIKVPTGNPFFDAGGCGGGCGTGGGCGCKNGVMYPVLEVGRNVYRVCPVML